MTSRVKTVPVRVKLYTEEYVLTGMVHTRPGGYRERVSDIVNDASTRFLVLTEATFRPVTEQSGAAKRCGSLLVRVEDIKLLIPFEDANPERGGRESGGTDTW